MNEAITDIDIEATLEGHAQWEAANNYLDSSCSGKFSSGFSSLYFATGYINEIEKSIREILSKSTQQAANFKALVDSISPAIIPDDGGNGGGGGGDGSGGGGGGTTPGVIPVPAPTVEEIEDGKAVCSQYFEGLKLSELDGFVGELVKLAELKNVSLDQLLADDKYSDLIKALLLESPNVPDDLKEILLDFNSSIVREIIAAMMRGEMPDVFMLNELNLEAINNYLSLVAEENGITLDQLLNEKEYASLLKDKLAGMDEAAKLFGGLEDVSAEEVQSVLLDLYTGDTDESLLDNEMPLARSFIDNITEKTEILYEDLLTSPDYSDTVKEAIVGFGKAVSFFGAVSNFSQENMGKTVTSVLG